MKLVGVLKTIYTIKNTSQNPPNTPFDQSLQLFSVVFFLTLAHLGGSDHKPSEESKAYVLLHSLPELTDTEDVFP